MDKLTKLRKFIADTTPALASNPDKLHVFVEKGEISAWQGNSLGYMYKLPIVVVVTDYPDHPDTLIVPILSWVAQNQVDLLQNPQKKESAITFDAELLSNNTYDIELKLMVTESVDVRVNQQGEYQCEHRPEPDQIQLNGTLSWELFVKGEKIEPMIKA